LANASDKSQLAYPAGADFYELLRWHLFVHGTRPTGSPHRTGKRWSQKEFADELGVTEKSVSNWLREENPTPPRDYGSIERVLFDDSAAYEGWRRGLRWAFNRTKEGGRLQTDSPPQQDHRQPRPAHPDFGIARAFQRVTRAFLDEYLVSETGSVPFGGRDSQLKCLDDWLSDPSAVPRMLVTAPAGRGKSALLVQWMKSLQDRGQIGEDGWQLVFMAISIRVGTNLPGVFLTGLAQRLAEVTDKPIAREAVQDADALKYVVQDQLDAVASSGEKTLVVLDGLDEALQGSFDPSIIPARIPQTLRVLLSARWQVGDVDSAGWLRRLGWDRNVRVENFELERLPPDGIADVLLKLGAPTNVLSQEKPIIARLAELTEGEPILVRYYAEDLWNLGRERPRITRSDLDSLKPGFGAYFGRWLSHQEKLWDDEGLKLAGEEIERVLSILAFALGPLPSRDLLDLMKTIHGAGNFLSEHHLLQPLRRFILGDGKPDSGYVLSHPKIGEYLQNERFGARARALCQGFAAWGQGHLRELNAKYLNANSIASGDVSPYALQFLSGHFANAGLSAAEWMEFIENGWRLAWEQFEGVPRGFAGDVRAAWDVIRRAANRTTMIGEDWRCALVLSSIRSIGLNTPDELLCAAVADGMLSIRQVMHFVELGRDDYEAIALLVKLSQLGTVAPGQSINLISIATEKARCCRDARDRSRALGLLASHLPAEQKIEAIRDSLAAALAIGDERARAFALGSLAPRLSTEQIGEAFTAAMAIGDDRERAHALGSLAPYLSAEQVGGALSAVKEIGDEGARVQALGLLAPPSLAEQTAEALAAVIAIRDEQDRAQALGDLAPHLAAGPICEALAVAKAIDNEHARAHALQALAPYLSAEQIGEAFTAVRAIGNPRDRQIALGWLAPHLSTEQIGEALAAATKTTDNGWPLVYALEALAPHLSIEQIGEALAIACAIGDDRHRARALGSLAPFLPADKKTRTIGQALRAARAIGDNEERVRALRALAPFLAADQKTKTIGQALDAAGAIGNEVNRAKALESLAPYLSAEQIGKALDTAGAIDDEGNRAYALGLLAPHLSAEQLGEALDTARVIGDEGHRAKALGLLAPHLSAEQKTKIIGQALDAARAIDAEWKRASALKSLAPLLSAEQIGKALDIAGAIGDEIRRAYALGLLAPFLSAEQKTKAIGEAFDAARAIGDEGNRAYALGSLARHLSAEQIGEALDAARAISNEGRRAEALGTLAPHLSAEHIGEALDIARAIGDYEERVRALGALAPFLSAEQKATTINQALDAARAIGNDWDRAMALTWLAPRLSAEQIGGALSAAKAIGDGQGRAKALGALAPHISTEQIGEALVAAHAIADELDRALALRLLAPYLSVAQIGEAITAATAISNGRTRAFALNSLTEYVEPSQDALFLNSLVDVAAKLPRNEALQAISESIHISATLGGADALERLHRAITDTAQWYP